VAVDLPAHGEGGGPRTPLDPSRQARLYAAAGSYLAQNIDGGIRTFRAARAS